MHPPSTASLMSAASSVSSLSMDSATSNSGPPMATQQKPSHHTTKLMLNQSGKSNGGSGLPPQIPIINPQLVQNASQKNTSPDFYIIRVTYETDNVELDGIVMYKSIMLGNNERTPQVIRNSMMKLGLECDPDKWTLAQCLPDKELVMPPNANVYYAVNTAFNLNFILRPKKDDNNKLI